MITSPASRPAEDAVHMRRAILESDLRAEGTPEHMVSRLATDETAERMLAYEWRTMDFIAGLFAGASRSRETDAGEA